MAPNPHFAAIAGPLGHLLIEFNGVEMDAGTVIARLLGHDDLVAAAFASSMSFSRKVSLIETLSALKVKDGVLAAEFKELIAQARRANSARNQFIHGEYFALLNEYDEQYGVVFRKLRDVAKDALRGGGYNFLQDVEVKELTRLAEEFSNLGQNMRKIAERLTDFQ